MGETRVLVMARPEPGAVELVHRSLERLQPGEARVRLRRAGICGTDLHIMRWDAWARGATGYPLPSVMSSAGMSWRSGPRSIMSRPEIASRPKRT